MKKNTRVARFLGRALGTAACFFSVAAAAGDLAAGSELGSSIYEIGGNAGVSFQNASQVTSNEAVLYQHGSQHVGLINQYGIGNEVHAIQDGLGNQFELHQAGSGNGLLLLQAGQENQAFITQGGHNNRAVVEQIGNANVVTVLQIPFGPNFTVQQNGNGMAAKVVQY